jgi:hypothetical protein
MYGVHEQEWKKAGNSIRFSKSSSEELRNTLEEWFEFTPENYNAK